METVKKSSLDFFADYAIYGREVLIFATVLLFVRWILLQWSYNKNSKPSAPPLPYPPGLPFFGNMFSFRTDMRDILRKWTNDLGGLFRLRIGPMVDIVVISDVDAIQEAFVDQANAFSERDIPPLLEVAMGTKGSIFGQRWKQLRRFGHRALRHFGINQGSMEDSIIEEGRLMAEAFEMKEGTQFNPKVLVTNTVGNVITRFVFGFRFEYGDPVFEKLAEDFELSFESFSITSLGSVFPFLYYTPLYTNFRRPIQDVVSYIKSVVNDHRRSFDPLHLRDVIDLHMAEVKGQRDENKMAAMEEGWEWKFIFELYAAGLATTTDTLRWAILIAAQHPQLVHEVQKEIDDVIGGRSPKFSDQSLMPLTGATMLEITRIRPVVPLGVPRCTSRDAVVQGYHIPKNTTVLMNLWELQTSPKYWKEPDKFNPYRFLSEDRKTIVSHRALNPFGIGLRVCLGEKLARMQLFIIFTSLLQRFTLRLADDSLAVGMEGKAGLAYGPLDYNIVLEKRNV
ncbi:cytochrome P450 2U1-like [Strongylocentrotus purpuratus]|uniref:Cytochrome P450 n=1 Tax=Strongylocentrotus purpuratus TaxID=7668 RepID=A0A7M7NXZ8_STRPU|nr:cytochrome P450 2U1-like [Strongylocentrotus purpuratus]